MFIGTCLSLWISEHIRNWVGDRPIRPFLDYIDEKRGGAEGLSEKHVDELSVKYVEEYGEVFAVLDHEFIGGKYRQSRARVEALKINGNASDARLNYEKAILLKCERSLRSSFGYSTSKQSEDIYAILIRSIGLSMDKCRLSDDDERDGILHGLFRDHWDMLVRQIEGVIPGYDGLT